MDKLSVVSVHDYFGVSEVTRQIVCAQQIEYWAKQGALHHAVRHWSAVTVHHTLRTVAQPVPKPVSVNTVPPELLQEPAMRNAVKGL